MDIQQLIEHIKTMQAQGLSNNQIIESLQRDGFSSSQIFEAMNQVALAPPGGMNMNQAFPPPPKPQNPQVQPPRPAPSAPAPTQQMPHQQSVEEMVEAVIDEKWNELVKDITTIIEWKNQTQNTITSMEQQFVDLKGQFDKLHQALIAKIGEYDKNILDVGAEVKAMEKVFSKVLPLFTQNVAELSRITKELKKE